jgi:hypothetical protein
LGEIINTADTIIVKLNRRAYSPVLGSADLPADTTVPWGQAADSASTSPDPGQYSCAEIDVSKRNAG